jgi:hypothetical protein
VGERVRGLALAVALLASSPAPAADFLNEEGPKKGEPEQVPLFVPLLKSSAEASKPPLHFSVVGDGRSRMMVAWGKIVPGDAERFREAIAEAKPIGELRLYSPGGALADGLQIGRIVRANKLAVRVPSGWQCNSACNFIVMGGVLRYVDLGAIYGIHMFDDSSYLTLQQNMADPPVTLFQFLQSFPHRHVDEDKVAEEVAAKNAARAQLVAKLQKAKEELVASLKKPPAPVASAEKSKEEKALEDLDTTIESLSRPYTTKDWLRDEAMNEDVRKIQQMSAETAAEIARFLVEMSMSLKYLTQFSDTPTSSLHVATRPELRELNIVNTDQ